MFAQKLTEGPVKGFAKDFMETYLAALPTMYDQVIKDLKEWQALTPEEKRKLAEEDE
jgi:hypothetical protein